MSADRYLVVIDRSDGSRTYKGSWSLPHCQREATAWRESFPSYGVRIVTAAAGAADLARWARAVSNPGAPARYYPRELVTP